MTRRPKPALRPMRAGEARRIGEIVAAVVAQIRIKMERERRI
jgi:hypothetical protein